MKNRDVDWDDRGERQIGTVPMIIIGGILLAVIVVLCVLIWKLFQGEDKEDGSLPSFGISGEIGEEDPLKEKDGTPEQLPGNGTLDEDRPSESTENLSGESTVPTADTNSEDTPPDNTQSGSINQDDTQSGGQKPDASDAEGQGISGEGTDGSGKMAMTFRDVNETVTAKDVTNLRSEPGTGEEDTVVTQLKNGETALRTGINQDTGWSRVEYEGQTLYAASSLLTTDLNAKPPQSQNKADANTVVTAGGRTITFTPCDDTVSPKIEVNLRTEPSTSQGDTTVRHLLKSGEKMHRTGYDTASGWSRVEYGGEILYVVTSYVNVVEETPGE